MSLLKSLPLEIENIIIDYKEQLELNDEYYHIIYGSDTTLYRIIKGSETYFKSGKKKGQLKEFKIAECLDNGEFSLITDTILVKQTASRLMGRRQRFWSSMKLTIYKGYVENYLDPSY